MPAPVDGNERRSLAKHVKHHKHLQCPPLKDGSGRRKTLPSAMSSCLGLEPHHVSPTQTLEYPNIPADNYPHKKMEIKGEKSRYL